MSISHHRKRRSPKTRPGAYHGAPADPDAYRKALADQIVSRIREGVSVNVETLYPDEVRSLVMTALEEA